MTSSTQNLLNIAAELNAAGKEVKITRLRTSHGSKANRYAIAFVVVPPAFAPMAEQQAAGEPA